MQLKSITFNDFRCFRGKISIDLKPNDDKNIIVILGDNTNGKSTIVQSFVWCFYGKSNFENPEIYNRDLANNMPSGTITTPSVEVIFEHEDKTYIARRSQEFRKRDDGRIVAYSSSEFRLTYIDPKTGESLPCGTMPNEYTRTIKSILPDDLAQYFFFEGEKNQNLTTKSLGDAVKNLMGIQPLSNMKTHLFGDGISKPSANSVIGYYQGKLASPDNQAAQNEWEKRTKAEEELEKINKDIVDYNNLIKDYQTKIDEIDKILRDAAPTKDLQLRRDKVKKDYDEEKNQLDRCQNNYLYSFNDKAMDLFMLPLLTKANQKLSQMDVSDKGVKDLTMGTLKDLLHRGMCLCGTDLKEGSLAYKNVEKYFDYVLPKNIGMSVRSIQDQIKESESNGYDYMTSEIEGYSDVQYCIKKLNDLERQEEDLMHRLSETKDINIKQYEEDLQQYKKRVTSLQGQLISLNYNKGTQQSAFDTANNNYSMYASKMKKNAEYQIYLNYAYKLYEWLNKTYAEKEKNVREKLQKSVTDLFNSIYSGNRTVTIDESYNIRINPSADTGGLKAIQYFSYVGGLVQVAKQVMKERQEGELYGEEYPLVLDAAFSHTDKNHTKAIALELSKVTNQLIFAIMDKDWEHVGNKIANKIAKTYVLKKISEDQVEIEPVEEV